MNDLIALTQVFGPITGLIMFIIYRLVLDLQRRQFDDTSNAKLDRIEGGVSRIESAVIPAEQPPQAQEEVKPDVTDQPPE